MVKWVGKLLAEMECDCSRGIQLKRMIAVSLFLPFRVLPREHKLLPFLTLVVSISILSYVL